MDGCVIVLHTTPEQEERLKKLLSWHRNHTDAVFPAQAGVILMNHLEAELLECLVNIHAKELVEFLLSEEERRQGIIPEKEKGQA